MRYSKAFPVAPVFRDVAQAGAGFWRKSVDFGFLRYVGKMILIIPGSQDCHFYQA